MAVELNFDWIFGFSKDSVSSVHSLATSDRNAFFFISSHSGVIYDYERRQQIILQGHCNPITCSYVSYDKRWIFTADSGNDSILVVWDSLSGVPVCTMYAPSANGVIAMNVTSDSLFIATLGLNEIDGIELCIWPWTTDPNTPLIRRTMNYSDPQLHVSFHPSQSNEIVTWGDSSLIFWDWQGVSIEGYMGSITQADVGHFTGKFTASVFLEGFGNAVTTTSDGYVILWESAPPKVKGEKSTRIATKVIRLMNDGINLAVTTPNGYLVLGCNDGAVRFYDFFLRLEAWFEDLAAGPVTSVSLAHMACPYAPGEGGSPGLRFWCPDILVGTSQAFVIGVESQVFNNARPEERRGTLLLQGITERVVAVACHPSQPLLAILCVNNTLQIWNYEIKLLLNIRTFHHTLTHKMKKDAEKRPIPSCLTFDPRSTIVAVGFTNGQIKLLDAETLRDVETFSPTSFPITKILFNDKGDSFSCFDSGNYLLLFKVSGTTLFDYIGRIKPHLTPIVDIQYYFRDSVDILMSVASDSSIIEYDVTASTIQSGILLKDSNHNNNITLDMMANPTGILWHPHMIGDEEDRFVVVYDSFKFKEYNTDSKTCRKTSLAPTYGGTLKSILAFRMEEKDVLLYFYSTGNRIIGIGSFPLTGNPTKNLGIVAHSGEVTSISSSYDGKYVFSAGGSDLSVNMMSVVVHEEALHKDDYLDYIELIEGGAEGPLFNDMMDYFYFCQIRAQGEETLDQRELKGEIPLEEIPNFMRAIGYYPTEVEIDNIMNEIRYRHFATTGVLETSVGISDLIKLYVNYHPVVPLGSSQIYKAFQEITRSLSDHGDIEFGELKTLMTTQGEPIPRADLEECLRLIAGASHLNDFSIVNANMFATDILGFQEDM